jgi:hypothetical protein
MGQLSVASRLLSRSNEAKKSDRWDARRMADSERVTSYSYPGEFWAGCAGKLGRATADVSTALRFAQHDSRFRLRARIFDYSRQHPSGAKARGSIGGLAARLKSCPFTKLVEVGERPGTLTLENFGEAVRESCEKQLQVFRLRFASLNMTVIFM